MGGTIALMVAAGGGTVVNVSSVATRGVNRVPYAAAKGGVNAITACLAMEYAGCGIRVCGVAPGGTEAPPRRIPRNAEPPTEQETGWYQQVVDQTVSSSLMTSPSFSLTSGANERSPASSGFSSPGGRGCGP